MVFFVLTAGLSCTFANLLIPLQIGARDMASPFMNMLSYWFFLAASIVLLGSFFIEAGPASSGWTVYPPLSALPQAIPGSGLGRSEEHQSELQSLMRISYAVFCLKKKNNIHI